MLKLLWQSQLLMRVSPWNCIRMTEKTMCLLKVQYANCSTSSLEYRKYKPKRALYGLQTPFKHYYNVGYSELVGLLSNHLTDLRTVNKSQIDELLLLLKKKEYKWSDIRMNKEILLLKPSDIRNRLQLLDEFSVFHPRLHDVAHIRIYLQSKIALLRQFNVYHKSFDVLDHLLFKLEELELSEEVLRKIRQQFEDIDQFSLADIHIYIMVHYFSKRFNVDICDAKLILEGHHLPIWKPLTSYIKICDTIIDTLDMGLSDILNFPKLLNIDTENVLRIVAKHEAIGGIPMIELIKAHPQLLLIPQSSLSKWILLLDNYKVKKFEVTPDTFRLFKSNNFKVVEERLQVLQRIPEYELIQVSTKFFELLRDPHAIKKLMEAAHAGTVLSSLGPVPVSQNHHPRVMSQEMKIYAARKLGLDENKGEDLLLLNEVRTTLGLTNLHIVLNLLLDFGFSKQQVINGIQIVSFEHSILKSALEEFPLMPEAQPFDEWMANPYVIHLLAYFIKRNTSHW